MERFTQLLIYCLRDAVKHDAERFLPIDRKLRLQKRFHTTHHGIIMNVDFKRSMPNYYIMIGIRK